MLYFCSSGEFYQVVNASNELFFFAGNVDSYVVVPFFAKMHAWDYCRPDVFI